MRRQVLRRPLGKVRRGVYASYRRATTGGRMLPTFLIIGAQKAGTTSLHQFLAEHPDVGRPATKEIHYFDHNAYRSLDWYRSHFPPRTRAAQVGEATPYYLFHPCCPERVRAAIPDVKLIVLLRDPVERAHSHHNHEVALGYEQLDFASALAREPERLAGEEARIRADPRYRSFAHQHYSYVARGMYAEQLERWYAHFPREQMFVLASETFFADPGSTLHAVQTWLGLASHTPPRLSPLNARTYDAMDSALRAQLRSAFAPDKVRLHELIDAELPWPGPTVC